MAIRMTQKTEPKPVAKRVSVKPPPVAKPAAKQSLSTEPGPKRGRPRVDAPKEAVTLRLDPAIVAKFKAIGDDWRARMNDVLAAVKL